jgi:4-hydroxybenzoate polyprenyltransferase
MLELTCVCLGAIWACSGSSIPWVVLILALGSFVYSCEPYRAKRLLPYSLMIEGLWGAAAILCGIVASVEDTFGTPPIIAERPAGRAVVELLRADDAFRVSTMAVIPAAFVGWFLVSAHKDFKDVAADEKAGVQTIYTWGRARKWPEASVHAWVTRVTVGCIFTMGPLVVLNGYRGVAPIVLSAVAAVLGYFCSRDRQRQRGFQLLLLILTAELLGLAAVNTLFVPDQVR